MKMRSNLSVSFYDITNNDPSMTIDSDDYVSSSSSIHCMAASTTTNNILKSSVITSMHGVYNKKEDPEYENGIE